MRTSHQSSVDSLNWFGFHSNLGTILRLFLLFFFVFLQSWKHGGKNGEEATYYLWLMQFQSRMTFFPPMTSSNYAGQSEKAFIFIFLSVSLIGFLFFRRSTQFFPTLLYLFWEYEVLLFTYPGKLLLLLPLLLPLLLLLLRSQSLGSRCMPSTAVRTRREKSSADLFFSLLFRHRSIFAI